MLVKASLVNFLPIPAEQQSCANLLTVFINTNRFKKEKIYSNSVTVTLPEATDDTTALIHDAFIGLKGIFLKGYEYQKVDVILSGISPKAQQKLSIFSPSDRDRKEMLMLVMDTINTKYGRDTVKIAATGTTQEWQMQREMLSLRYTTCWDDLLKVRC